MSKKLSGRFEKYICIENRCGAFRFKLVIYPVHDSATFSTVEEGALCARRRRVKLLEEKARSAKVEALPEVVSGAPVFPQFPFLPTAPAPIKLSDVFDSFERIEIAKLAGQEAGASRLTRLRKWFGARTLGQLNENFIDRWKVGRL